MFLLDSKNDNSLKSKEIQNLLKKEKELHEEIRNDYKKISEKIIIDFNQIQKSKTSK